MKKVEIHIDMEDAAEEVEREGYCATNEDEMLDAHVLNKYTPTQSGRRAAAVRAMGKADADILPPDKALYEQGCACAVIDAFARQTHDIKVGEVTYKVPDYVGSVLQGAGDEGENETYISVNTPEAARRARQYTVSRVAGHVAGRLAILAEHGADLREPVDALVEQLYDLLDEMTPAVA